MFHLFFFFHLVVPGSNRLTFHLTTSFAEAQEEEDDEEEEEEEEEEEGSNSRRTQEAARHCKTHKVSLFQKEEGKEKKERKK